MFSHLHVHTEYSALDGLSKIEDLIIRAKELGQNALAITDHGSTSGLFEAHQLSQKHDFKIIYGSEFYFENVGDSKRAGHLILLAKNNQGLENLYKLQSLAYTTNFYYKPRINLDMLRSMHEGLICLSACMANQIAQYIIADEEIMAMSHMYQLKEIFGDDFYLELQSSTLEEQIKINKVYADWYKRGLAKIVTTNDVHYTLKDDAYTHEVLLAIQQAKKMNDPKRWKFSSNDFWLKSEEEIVAELKYIDADIIADSFSYIQEIIDKCDVTFESGNFLPHYNDIQNPEDEDKLLEELVMEKYMTRIKERGEDNKEFFSDLCEELNVIKETGYSGYFLIVQEYANWARDNNILVGDGRGSGAGSKVAYTLGITEINPQKHSLLFERFLAIGREPDFDIDFSDINAVFGHLQDVYGPQNVARVGAFNRMTAKSAIRKVMGAFNQSMSEMSRVVGYLPQRLSFTLEEAMNESEELRDFFDSHKDWYKLVARLEGVMSHMSTHAGGVIICEDLMSKLPVLLDKDDNNKLVIGLDKKALESLGHYKFDILGLNSLTLLSQTLSNIDDKIDWFNVDYEDQNVYNMLCTGDVLGVFQLADQRDKVMQQQPRCFEDLIAINALIRPGVGDWNEYLYRRASADDYRTDRTPYLNSTHGVIVYQEQYLLLANTYAGWSIAYSDKAIRKNKDIINDIQLHQSFINDAIALGYDVNEIEIVWNQICEVVSSGYGFNRSHSTSYARLSFQTAYLKCYYPKEFYASLLTLDGDDTNKILNIKSQLDRLNIKLLHPDVNESGIEFKPTDEGILYRLTSINGVGGSTLYEINRLRPIDSLSDFMTRRIPKFVKITTLVNLIKSGCFDFEGKTRTELLQSITNNVELNTKKDYDYEKEALGFYLSDTPYEKFDTKDFKEYPDQTNVLTIVEVISVNVRFDKNGNEMAFVTGMNKHGSINMILFTKLWNTKGIKELMSVGGLVMVRGKKDKNSLLVNTVEEIIDIE